MADDVQPGSRYLLEIDAALERPAPASFHQLEGVHGSSAVVDHAAFHWTDRSWTGRTLEELILYEMHVTCPWNPQDIQPESCPVSTKTGTYYSEVGPQ